MKKRKKKISSRTKIKKRHHHIKLLTLFTSKLATAIIAFTIGIYLGSLFKDTFTSLIVAVIFATLFYLLSILHIIKWLEI